LGLRRRLRGRDVAHAAAAWAGGLRRRDGGDAHGAGAVRGGVRPRGAGLEGVREGGSTLRAPRRGRHTAGGPCEGAARARLGAQSRLPHPGRDDGGRRPGARGVKVFVTGADGFVGRWLIRRLLDDGRDVSGAVRASQPVSPGGGEAAFRLRVETDPVAPCSPYAASKAGSELATLEAWRRTGLRVVVARPFAHTGPGQDTRFVVPALAQRLTVAKRVGAPVVKVG